MNALTHTLPLAGEDFVFAWPAMTMFDIADDVAGGDVNALSQISASQYRTFLKSVAVHGYRTGCLVTDSEPDEAYLLRYLQLATMDEMSAVARMGQDAAEEGEGSAEEAGE